MKPKASLGGGGACGLEDEFSTIKRSGTACASFRMKLSSAERAHCCSSPPHWPYQYSVHRMGLCIREGGCSHTQRHRNMCRCTE